MIRDLNLDDQWVDWVRFTQNDQIWVIRELVWNVRELLSNVSRAGIRWLADPFRMFRAEWSDCGDQWARSEWLVHDDLFSVIRELLSDDQLIHLNCMIYSLVHHWWLYYAYICFEHVWLSNLHISSHTFIDICCWLFENAKVMLTFLYVVSKCLNLSKSGIS